jgi:glc operon protein GlcG
MPLVLLLASAVLATAPSIPTLVNAEPTLSADGATLALAEAERLARASNAPSAIAIVDRAGTLLRFAKMDGVRVGSVDLAIGKAHAAAVMERPTVELEANVASGRIALATSGLLALRGGVPIVVGGACVGAVGVAGLNKDQDTMIADAVAADVSKKIHTNNVVQNK